MRPLQSGVRLLGKDIRCLALDHHHTIACHEPGPLSCSSLAYVHDEDFLFPILESTGCLQHTEGEIMMFTGLAVYQLGFVCGLTGKRGSDEQAGKEIVEKCASPHPFYREPAGQANSKRPVFSA